MKQQGLSDMFSGWDSDFTEPTETVEETQAEEQVQEETQEDTQEATEEALAKENSGFEEAEEADQTEEVADVEEVTDTEDASEESQASVFKNLALDLKDRGVFSDEDFEGLEDAEFENEETFYQLEQRKIEREVERYIDELSEAIGEDGANFIRYVKEGGDANKYLASLSNDKPTVIDINLPTEQKKIVRYALQQEGKEKEEIDDFVAWLEETGKLKSKATAYHQKIEELDKQKRQQLLDEQKRQKEEQLQRFQETKKSLAQKVTELDNYNAVTFTNADKQGKLIDYITKPDKSGVTGFVQALNSAMNDHTKVLALAKVLMDDFQLEDSVNKKASKKVSQLKSRVAKSAPTNRKKNSLWDFTDVDIKN